MHELSLTESVVRILEEQVASNGATRVKTVWLEIGALSHVDPEAMRFCFGAVAKGTPAENAVLEILRPAGQAWCHDCEKTVEIAQRYDPCPHCGGHKLQVTAGDEMRLKELEVE